jgi:hypothetical protein
MIPSPPFLLCLVHLFQATKGLHLAFDLEFLHMQCLRALSKYSWTTIEIATEHIVNVGKEDRTEFTNYGLPAYVSIEEIDVSCLSTLFIRDTKCSTLGLMVPIGSPR